MSRKRTVYSDAVLEFDAAFVAKSAENTQIALGMADPTDNRAQRKQLLMLLHRAMRTELTPTQRNYCIAYYENACTMKQIAEQYGVDESTVSRTIHRGQRRLYRLLHILAHRDT